MFIKNTYQTPVGNIEDLEALAAQQGVSPIENYDLLWGDFWPSDEMSDEFLNALEEWRKIRIIGLCPEL